MSTNFHDYPVLGGPVIGSVVNELPAILPAELVAGTMGAYPDKFIMVSGKAIRKSFSLPLMSEDPLCMVGQFSELFGRTLRDVGEAAYHIEAYKESGGAVNLHVDVEAQERELKMLRVRFGDVTLAEGRALEERFRNLKEELDEAKQIWRSRVADKELRIADIEAAAQAGRDWITEQRRIVAEYEKLLSAWSLAQRQEVDESVRKARAAKDAAQRAWDYRRIPD